FEFSAIETERNLLRSKEYWSLIENGVTVAPANPTAEQTRLAHESKLCDLKVKNYLFQSIDRSILETILERETTRDIWEAMRRKYQGSTKVKRAQLQSLRREFEVLAMGESESVNDYFARTLAIANKMTSHGEQMNQTRVVEKILRSMPSRFNYVVCSIEESNDVTTHSIDELQSSLLVQEGRMKTQKEHSEEQALKISDAGRGNGRGNGRGRGRNTSRGRGRGRQQSRDLVQCYKCHKFGHYQSNCPEWDNVNFCEIDEEEETLLMADVNSIENNPREEMWYLDSGCSNHMTGKKEWLHDFDGSFTESVKLGNDSKMAIMGKGNVKLKIAGKVHVITDVYYIPGLSSNLLSVDQLQQKNLTVVFKNDLCQVIHNEKGLILTTQISANRMYMIFAPVILPNYMQMSKTDEYHLWHNKYAHLNFKGLKVLNKKHMVKGLPELKDIEDKCGDCLSGKQHRDSIPKKSTWRASTRLELVHTDICGPIKPESNGGNISQGIKRKLTAAYTPQQNGVSERKNRTILNMVRSMLTARDVPKRFWPEAVNWATYVMNRSPTFAVQDMTPEEAWSGLKPSIHHFRIFVRNPKPTNYTIPEKKIIVSRDVIFEEQKRWNWNKENHKNPMIPDSAIEMDSDIIAEDNQPVTPDENQSDDAEVDMDTTQSSENEESEGDNDDRLPPRPRRPLGYLADYDTTTGEEE
ncbi:copia-type polyprotein, partial [Trifolium pratense]